MGDAVRPGVARPGAHTIHDAGWTAGRRTTDVADDGDDDTAILLAVKLADRLVFDAATGAVTFEIDVPGEGREP